MDLAKPRSDGSSVRDLSRSRLAWLVLSSLLALSLTALAFAESSSAQSEEVPPWLANEGVPPPGANVPCDPSAQHPYPVVLVHGTFETMEQNWAVLSPRLKEKGYCVFALNYGNRGLEPIQGSARELDGFVDNVLAYTGAEKVSLVGHSQGGMMPRYWIKYLGGRSEVEDLVGIAPSNYGTELNKNDFQSELGIVDPCPACDQQQAGSKFLKRLNRGDDTPGPGSFTQIATKYDEIIIPYTRCFLKGRELTENITLQRYNEANVANHQDIYNDPDAQALVFDALRRPGPARPGRVF
jgi:triacylglycerol esterase/lipase EstA (alpha/beta hydrolase family)